MKALLTLQDTGIHVEVITLKRGLPIYKLFVANVTRLNL